MYKIQMAGNIFFLVIASSVALAALDPCPAKQHDFSTSVAATQVAWQKVNTELGAITFSRSRFQAQMRTKLEEQSVKDIEDTLTAVNSTRSKDKQLAISKISLSAAAKKKVDLMLARPEMKKAVEQATLQAEDAFLQQKAAKQVELAQKKKQMDDQIDVEHKKLDDNCKYDFPSQLVRIVSQLLQIDMRIQDGMVTVGQFKTDIPVISAGKVMLGNHYLMDLPVIKDGQVQIGGTTVSPVPVILGGQVLLPATVLAGALQIPLPKIDVPVKIGNGNDGHGLNVQVGNWKF